MNGGTVKQLNSQKGFGLATNEENGKDIFVHLSGIVTDGFKSLGDGQSITFDITNDNRGLQAVNVYAVQCSRHRWGISQYAAVPYLTGGNPHHIQLKFPRRATARQRLLYIKKDTWVTSPTYPFKEQRTLPPQQNPLFFL